MSLAHSSPPTARIRILGCEDPAPPPRRRPSLRLIVIAALTSVAGIAAALALRPHPQAAPPRPADVAPVSTIGAMGSINPASWHPTRDLHRAMRAATVADLTAAARVAQRAEARRVVRDPAPAAVSTAASQAPAPMTSSSVSGTDSGTSSSASQSQPVVGPELPPGPMNPGVAAP